MKGVLGGLQAWLVQRLSSVYLAGYLGYAVLYLAAQDRLSYPRWSAWLTQPVMLVATGLFVLTLLLHAWVGMRDIVLDYVKPAGLRIGVLFLLMLFFLACGLYAFTVLLKAA